MGYRVALMADSTSRWAEALREISSRLEEMPGEEGYPTYLAPRLATFYERRGAGRPCSPARSGSGSVSIVAAISPAGRRLLGARHPGLMRVAGALLGARPLARPPRHFPAINWKMSYSLYTPSRQERFGGRVGADWAQQRREAMTLLQKEEELQEIVQLVGFDSLPDADRISWRRAADARGLPPQNAFHEVDAFCPLPKQYGMLAMMLHFHGVPQALRTAVPPRGLLALTAGGDRAARELATRAFAAGRPSRGAGRSRARPKPPAETRSDRSVAAPAAEAKAE